MVRLAEVRPSSDMNHRSSDIWEMVSQSDISMSCRVWRSPFMRVSAEMRRAMMFSNGLSMNYTVGSNEYKLNKNGDHAIDVEWAQFAHDVDIHLILYGFAIFRASGNSRTPSIVDPSNVTIFVNHDGDHVRYIVQHHSRGRLSMSGARDMVGVRVIERNPPNTAGRLTCDAKSLYQYLFAHDTALELAPVAWLADARPTCYLRHASVTDKDHNEVDVVVYGDAANSEYARIRASKEAAVLALAEQENNRAAQFIDSIQSSVHGSAVDSYATHTMSLRSTMLHPNLIKLPDHAQIDQVVRPQHRTTLEEVGKYFAMVVSRLMGVPAFDTGQSGARYTASVALTTTNATIRAAASELEIILSTLASDILQFDMAAHYVAVANARNAHGNERVSSIGRIKVTIKCSMSFDVLTTLYEHGMMEHEQYARAAAEATHVPLALFAPHHVDPLTGERVVIEQPPESDGGSTSSASGTKRANASSSVRPSKRQRTDIETAEGNLKAENSAYTGMK